MDIVVCSLYYDSFPKIKLKKDCNCLAYSIAIDRNILYHNHCILTHIMSPYYCQYTAFILAIVLHTYV